MNKLKKLNDLCEAGVFVFLNDHKNGYQTVEQYFDEPFKEEHKKDIPEDIYSEMVKTNTIVCIQFYPRTPVGFKTVHHYDIDMAIDTALKVLITNTMTLKGDIEWDNFRHLVFNSDKKTLIQMYDFICSELSRKQ